MISFKNQLRLKKNTRNNQQNGYIALVTVLMVIVVVVVTGVTVALLSISDVQMSLGDQRSTKAINLVDSCVNQLLLEINQSSTLSTTVSLPQGDCSIVLNSQVGNVWTFTVNGVYEGYSKVVQIQATRTNTVIVNSWIEI